MAKKRNNNRSFSFEDPVLYNGALYPSAQGNIVYADGQQQLGNVFADANGNYYALNDKGQAMPAMLTNTLPEVTVVPAQSKKQALMRAAGYDVPLNSQWDLYQQSIWDKLTTKPKQYDTTLNGMLNGLYDSLTGNSTYRTTPVGSGSLKQYNPNDVDWSKTRKSQNRMVNAIDGTWGPLVAMAMSPTALAHPIAAVVTGLGGAAGGYVANKVSEAITGRDIGTNVAMHTVLTPELGEIFNPGYTVGGIGAEKRMLDAVYNQVTPYGYGNDTPLPNAISKKRELGLAIKDFFTPKRINTSTNSNPAWMQRLNEDDFHLLDSRKKAILLRDDAWRLALRQKPRTIDINGKPHSLYIKNPDGTYRYDLDYINERRSNVGINSLESEVLPIFSNPSSLKVGKNNVVVGESIGYNGGYAGMEFNLPFGFEDKNLVKPLYRNYELNIDKPFRLYDRWDIQPLKDQHRSFIPAITNYAVEHPNVFTDYLRNFEVLEGIGGNPFMLDMQVPSNAIGKKVFY